jgi:hypothetical protein
MVWIAAVVFVASGMLLIARKGEIARGQSMLWGGTTVPGCVVIQGILLALVGLGFVVAWKLGLIGG